jgi:hypothetical protein
VEFLLEMVIEMQEGATCKACKTIIEITLWGKRTIKALHDYLKLHLPTSFVSTTLLIKGYFEVFFVIKEGRAQRQPRESQQ